MIENVFSEGSEVILWGDIASNPILKNIIDNSLIQFPCVEMCIPSIQRRNKTG